MEFGKRLLLQTEVEKFPELQVREDRKLFLGNVMS